MHAPAGPQLCSPGCLESWTGDGVCDKPCNTTSCNYDSGDCTGDGSLLMSHARAGSPDVGARECRAESCFVACWVQGRSCAPPDASRAGQGMGLATRPATLRPATMMAATVTVSTNSCHRLTLLSSPSDGSALRGQPCRPLVSHAPLCSSFRAQPVPLSVCFCCLYESP